MTDSLKVCLDLRSLPEEARRQVEIHYAQTRNKRHEKVGTPYAKPIAAVSACSGTGMELTTYWEGSGAKFLQSHIVGDINLPNAVAGQNFEHGTSVFAAGRAASELLKIWMVDEGVPADALASLTTNQVSLHGVTITYLLKSEFAEQAQAIVKHMESSARILGLRILRWDSTNETITISGRGFLLTAYCKTDFSHCTIADPELRARLQNQALRIVRIEVYMQGHLLRRKGWSTLDSWRHAYAEGRYAAIFEEMVRGVFKLNVKLRHKAPRREVMDQMTPTGRAILEAYFGGTPADALPSIKEGKTADARSKLKSKWRKLILSKAQIDIAIPWVLHQKLHWLGLNRALQYPGDHEPVASDAPGCFCKVSWPNWFKHLKKLFQEAADRQRMG